MRDRNHPFPFDSQAESVMKAFVKETGEELRNAQKQVGGGENALVFNHGGAWQSHHSYAPDRVAQAQTLSHETWLDMEDVMIGRLDVIERTKKEIVKSMAESFERFLYQMLSDTCEESGNVIDGNGKSIGEHLLETINSIEFSVNKDGTISRPELRGSPATAKLIENDPSTRSPEFQAKLVEILRRKVSEAIARESERKAKFSRKM
ncbi:hypothetical protein HU764_012140 [Pseudomonas sp. SWRI100]|nr:hypothetical protein [Pseudomonas sp. SWRI67]MBV4526848.1 hypothetical protein [Pseudomonas kermanshahensis]